jgi:tetratricopeptide (TPR) repeat protein
MFIRATELDPGFAAAYGMGARCYSQRKSSGWTTDSGREIADAERLARRAGELGKDDAVALSGAGLALAFVVGDLESGAVFTDRAVDLNPNLAWGWLFSGLVKVWLGEPEVALERIRRAMRLSPHDPHLGNMQGCAAWAHFMAGRYDEALSGAEAAVREQPNLMFAFCVAAASGALGGRLEAAQKAMAQVRRLDPTLRMSNLRAFFPTRRAEDFARWEEGLRIAGLPG